MTTPDNTVAVGHQCLTRKLPLEGTSIGITRPALQASITIQRALELGACPVNMPAIEIHAATNRTHIDQYINALHTYDWIIFTSVNSVDVLIKTLWERGRSPRGELSRSRLAAIGPSTAHVLKTFSLQADLVPDSYDAESLAEALRPHVDRCRVLWLRGSRGRDVLSQDLKAAGAVFHEATVYENRYVNDLPEKAIATLRSGNLDWIGLASPSIARSIAHLLSGENLEGVKLAAISPITKQAAADSGLRVDAVASQHTWEGIFRSIIMHESKARNR